MKQYRRLNYRLYPSKEQEQMFAQVIGNVRYVWNHFLTVNIDEYKETSKFIYYKSGMSKQLTKLKKEKDFLSTHTAAHALQNSIMDLEKAIKASYNPNMDAGFPKYKSKYRPHSFRIDQVNNHIKINDKSIVIPKIGEIKAKIHREIYGCLKAISVYKKNNNWVISCIVEIETNTRDFNLNNSVGIDTGIDTFATLSDGTYYKPENNYRKAEKKLKRLQRALSRCKKGSKNRQKQRLRLAKQHERVANKRKDFQHKLSTSIAKEYSVVFVEDLGLADMKEGKHAKSLSDQGIGAFVNMLMYKTNVVKIDRYYPSTKTCSACLSVKDVMPTSIRIYECECGLDMCRDLNAAINIKRVGQELPELLQVIGETPVETKVDESGNQAHNRMGSPVPLGAG